jgi:thiol-disulfide isomerase/thioredoxin
MVNLLNDEAFQQALATHENVVVKYFANWCGTCRLFAPKYKKLSEKDEYNNIYFIDINAEENPIARKMAKVSNLPFFATFKNGELVKSEATSKEEAVENMIKELNP